MASKKVVRLMKFKSGDPVFKQAQQIWMILSAYVTEQSRLSNDLRKETITYGEVVARMGRTVPPASLGRPLWIISKFCKAHNLPDLNSIVVNKQSEVPGKGIPNKTKIDENQKLVFKKNWMEFRTPSSSTFRALWETRNDMFEV